MDRSAGLWRITRTVSSRWAKATKGQSRVDEHGEERRVCRKFEGASEVMICGYGVWDLLHTQQQGAPTAESGSAERLRGSRVCGHCLRDLQLDVGEPHGADPPHQKPQGVVGLPERRQAHHLLRAHGRAVRQPEPSRRSPRGPASIPPAVALLCKADGAQRMSVARKRRTRPRVGMDMNPTPTVTCCATTWRPASAAWSA